MNAPLNSIIFVCTGNICRSPMAEGYFRYLCRQKGLNHIQISSAGIYAQTGSDCSPHVQTLLRAEAQPLTTFQSTQIDLEITTSATQIFTMTNEHQQQILSLFPHTRHKTQTLLSLIGSTADIQDPYGGDLTRFFACFHKMKPALDALGEQQLTR